MNDSADAAAHIIADYREFQTNLERLEAAWIREYPHQASGGRHAIRGFHFQFSIALLETVKRWLESSSDLQNNPRVFTEILSDVMVQSAPNQPKGVFICQVKLTQSSSSVRKALDEFLLIHNLCIKETPALVPHIQFRLISATTTLLDIENTIENWCAEHLDAADSARQLRSRVRVELLYDPNNELIALLANQLRAVQPLQTVQRWSGLLLEAAASTDGLRGAGRQIWEEVREIKLAPERTRPHGIYVWTHKDRPPREVVIGRYLTGEQPHVQHLVEGNFAPRPSLYESLVQEARIWMDNDPSKSDVSVRLQIFWLGGRSGAGKSVALLHVLALLHEEGRGPILWLGDKVSALPNAILWSRVVQQRRMPVLIGIDDPYTPKSQADASSKWVDALSNLQELKVQSETAPLPLLICCGPTEQAEALRDAFFGEVQVHLVELPTQTSQDLESLREWFRKRTGREPPAYGNDNVLPVQLFFEWKEKQSLGEFAHRLRRRIRETDNSGDMESVVSRMLAVNRLYVGYPSSAFSKHLTSDQQDALRLWSKQQHMGKSSTRGRPGVFWSHPHLANAIYESWYPYEHKFHVRREHLELSIMDCWKYGDSIEEQLAPLWALSQALRRSDAPADLAMRITSESAGAVLVAVYERFVSSESGLSMSHLPPWIDIEATKPPFQLKPSPIGLAIAAIEVNSLESPGMRSVCIRLLDRLPALAQDVRHRVIKAIVDLLSRSPDTLVAFEAVASMAIRRSRDYDFLAPVAAWIWRRPGHPSSSKLLLTALKHLPIWPSLRGFAIEWLAEPPSTQQRAIIRWRNIWRLLWVADDLDPELVAVAKSWLAAAPSGYKAYHNVLTALLRAVPADPDVLNFAQRFLIARPHHRLWWNIWRQLLERNPSNSDLIFQARRWLSGDYGRIRWAEVWLVCWSAAPDKDELYELALTWLLRSPKIKSPRKMWIIWKLLQKHNRQDDRLLLAAVSLLKNINTSWCLIWKRLLGEYPNRRELFESARSWLIEGSRGDSAWAYVWTTLWRISPGDGQLRDQAIQWLAEEQRHHAWCWIWEQVWENSAATGREILSSQGIRWLETESSDRRWGRVFLPLWAANYHRTTLAKLAEKWIGQLRNSKHAEAVQAALAGGT